MCAFCSFAYSAFICASSVISIRLRTAIADRNAPSFIATAWPSSIMFCCVIVRTPSLIRVARETGQQNADHQEQDDSKLQR